MLRRKKKRKRIRSKKGIDRRIILYYPALLAEDIATDLDLAYAEFEVSYMYLRFLSEPIPALTSLNRAGRDNKSIPGLDPHSLVSPYIRFAE